MAHIDAPIDIETFATAPQFLNLRPHPKQLEVLRGIFDQENQRIIVCCGRRSGKGWVSSIALLYAAIILAPQYRQYLSGDEPLYMTLVSTQRDLAKKALRRIKSFLEGNKQLKALITRETADTLEFTGNVVIQSISTTASNAVGDAVGFAILDECSRMQQNSEDRSKISGEEVYKALSPALAQFGDLGRTLLISSPWVSRGFFYDAVMQANSPEKPEGVKLYWYSTQEMNPNITNRFLEQEKEVLGLQHYRAEYLAEFQDSIDNWLDSFLIRQQVRHKNSYHKPNPEYYGHYILALDPASGKEGRDSFAACIGHVNQDNDLIIDRFHTFDGGKRGVDFNKVRDWVIKMHEAHGFQLVTADQHQARMLLQQLQSSGIPTRENHWTVTNHMQAFNKLSQLFISERISLPNHHQAIDQLVGLRQSWRQNGSFKVSGGAGSSVDDLASALAGVALFAPTELSSGLQFTSKPVSGWAA
jgi:hypothetical protein